MHQEKFYKLFENPALLNQETQEELRKLTTKYPFFQAAWILYLKNLKETGDSGFDGALKKVALLVPDRKQLYHLLCPQEKKCSGNIFLDKVRINPFDHIGEITRDLTPGNNLIEKFLTASPGTLKAEKPPREDSSNEKNNEIIARSVIESDEMLTETLAVIYFEQKKYDKAINAFKKLSLKYPEKSIYFANRIKEIEKIKTLK